MLTRALEKLGVVLLLAFACSACRQTPRERNATAVAQWEFLNLDPKVQYVGDDDCALCHSEIFKSFAQTGMGRSFYAPGAALAAEVAQQAPVYDAASKFNYEVSWQEGRLVQTEYRLDAAGRRTHELARTAAFVVGSGNHARTYLTQENGFICEMPLTWYAQKKNWGMSPGYAYVNSRFSRPVVVSCMNCHNSYAEFVPYSGNRYGEVPQGIGCERCHGPGALHVAQRYQNKLAEATRGAIDRTIVNPRHLSAAQQIDVCYQCHLQGEVRILKEGSNENDFRPGMRLQNVRSVYVLQNSPLGDFRVASHGERLALSACFKMSKGALVCTTCHNPHRSTQMTARSEFNSACTKCHARAQLSAKRHQRQSEDCVACHMPQGNTSDVVHVNFTDHWIQKNKFTPQAQPQDTAITLRDFFNEQDEAADVRLGIAYLHYYETARKDEAYFTRALSLLQTGMEKNPQHASGRYHLGLAYASQNNFAAAEREFHTLSQTAPHDARVFFEWGKVLQRQGKTAAAITAYEKAVQLWPENAPALTQLGALYFQTGKEAQARASFARASQAQPSYAPVYNALGEWLAKQQNDLAGAKKYFLRALHLEPDEATTLNNLGTCALAEGNYAESANYFTQALAHDPQFIPAYGNLAFVYALQKEYALAQKYLRRALEIEPNNAQLQSRLAQLRQAEQSSIPRSN